MATYSEIRIFFYADISIGTTMSFNGASAHSFTFVGYRYAPNQIEVGTPTFLLGERSAINFEAAFNADYNSTGIYEVIRSAIVVTIKAKTPDIDFSSFVSSVGTGSISPSILNYEGTPFSLTSLVFSAATSNPACTHYKVTIQTSIVTKYMSGSAAFIEPNTDNPFTIELLRGQAFNLLLTEDGGQTININYTSGQVPGILNVGKFDISLTNSPSGGTLLIIPLVAFAPMTIEYSLNNTDWQTDNQFTGLLEGSHTLYVRDNFGCSFTQSFSIDALNQVRNSYFLMPKSNSIRFANRVTWNDCSNYKTEENTLSCESTVKNPYKQIQLFQGCDEITTQYRSNYNTNTAVVIREDGTEVSVPVTKETQNMGLKDKRDARKYNLGNGKTGIYFVSGNIYDYDTGVDTGDDYILNGLLPAWAEVGTYISIGSAWYVIEDIVTDEAVNAQVVVITNTYTGVDTLIQVAAIYDLENFEEYEFTIDFADYINENVQVRVEAIDDDFDYIEQLSEVINVKSRQLNTVEIRYKNTRNTDLNFSRGLENKIRLIAENVRAVPLEESETSKTDTTARLIEAMVYEMDEFVFSPITTQLMRKLILALNHDTVLIDGVSYIKNDSLKVEGPLEDTNLYDVSATMIKGNSPFNSNVVRGNNITNSSDAEIPGLIESDNGYIKYV